ncbi:MAG: HAD-IC family P-type ATPase [Ancrocorticia sp.]
MAISSETTSPRGETPAAGEPSLTSSGIPHESAGNAPVVGNDPASSTHAATSAAAAQAAAASRAASPAHGLTAAEVEARRAAGQGNELPPRSGRTTGEIIRANVFTRINGLLGVLFIAVMLTGSWINGAFGLLIIVNSTIGIVQELRAKRTLDSLAVVGEAHPTVRREGAEQQVDQDAVVLGDIIVVTPGEQIVVDGEVTEAGYLEMDESLLTGESDAVPKKPGDAVLSGSFVASGTGSYRATKVGKDSYAAKLTAEAAKFSLVHSDLQAGINAILKSITWVLIPVGILTVVGQMNFGHADWRSIILAVSGALVPMIPEGLVLITSTAFAMGVIRLGRRKALVNELPAIEGLARVDVVCADKTGTLTENKMDFSELILLNSGGREAREGGVREGEALEVLRQLAAADPAPNSSMEAIIEGVGVAEKPWDVVASQPFTSAKKWSGVSFERPVVTRGSAGKSSSGGGFGGFDDDDGAARSGNSGETRSVDTTVNSYIIGAPDVLVPADSPAGIEAHAIAATGLRVLLLGRCSELVTSGSAPGVVDPLGLVVLEQRIRPDVADTLEYFRSQGVEVKVISGDNADSVGAVARSLGMDSGQPVDARTIEDENFAQTVNDTQVFGRVTPQQKRAMVEALQSSGRTVAMTGDGVNDVLALKDADLGVAMGSGTAATRSVAKIVLLDDKFATLPYVVAEGRRVLGNIERVANLFLTKTVYSSVIAILVLAFALPFPFQPIHVTITGWFTIGIPAFLLSLPPNNERARPNFVRRVLSFGFPAGIIVAAAAFTTFIFVRVEDHLPNADVQASTAALLALIITSTWVLSVVARPYEWWKVALVFLPLVGYGLIFNLDITQHFFMLDSSNMAMMGFATVAGLIGAVLIEALWWIQGKLMDEHRPIWLTKQQRQAALQQRRLEREAIRLARAARHSARK